MQAVNLFLWQSQYRGCWWRDHTRSRTISSHGTDVVILEYSHRSTRWFTRHGAVITQSIFSKIFTKDIQQRAPMRARYGVSFVSTNWFMFSLHFCTTVCNVMLYWAALYWHPAVHWWFRADSRFAPSQWEMSLQSKTVSHWLGTNLVSALVVTQLCVLNIYQILISKHNTLREHPAKRALSAMRKHGG